METEEFGSDNGYANNAPLEAGEGEVREENYEEMAPQERGVEEYERQSSNQSDYGDLKENRREHRHSKSHKRTHSKSKHHHPSHHDSPEKHSRGSRRSRKGEKVLKNHSSHKNSPSEEDGNAEDGEILEDGEIPSDQEVENKKEESDYSDESRSRLKKSPHKSGDNDEEEEGDEENDRDKKDKKKRKRERKEKRRRSKEDKDKKKKKRHYTDYDNVPEDEGYEQNWSQGVSDKGWKPDRSPPGPYGSPLHYDNNFSSPKEDRSKIPDRHRRLSEEGGRFHSPRRERDPEHFNQPYHNHYGIPGPYDSPSDEEYEKQGRFPHQPNSLASMVEGEYMDPSIVNNDNEQLRPNINKKKRRKDFRDNHNRHDGEPPVKKKPLLATPMDERPLCKFFKEGKCAKGAGCPFNHDFNPPKKPEVCKFYLQSFCHKGENCIYMHSDFPCKYFHTGATCYQGDNCKFSHDQLNEDTQAMLDSVLDQPVNQMQVEEMEMRPKKPSLLGSPPRHVKDDIEQQKKKMKSIPSLFDIQVFPPGQSPNKRLGGPFQGSPNPRPSGFYNESNMSPQQQHNIRFNGPPNQGTPPRHPFHGPPGGPHGPGMDGPPMGHMGGGPPGQGMGPMGGGPPGPGMGPMGGGPPGPGMGPMGGGPPGPGMGPMGGGPPGPGMGPLGMNGPGGMPPVSMQGGMPPVSMQGGMPPVNMQGGMQSNNGPNSGPMGPPPPMNQQPAIKQAAALVGALLRHAAPMLQRYQGPGPQQGPGPGPGPENMGHMDPRAQGPGDPRQGGMPMNRAPSANPMDPRAMMAQGGAASDPRNVKGQEEMLDTDMREDVDLRAVHQQKQQHKQQQGPQPPSQDVDMRDNGDVDMRKMREVSPESRDKGLSQDYKENEEDTGTPQSQDEEIDQNDFKNSSNFEIPSHLPPKQLELFMRIQQQLHEGEKKKSAVKRNNENEDKTSKDEDDNWYSSDDEDGPKPKLTDILKNLNKNTTLKLEPSSSGPATSTAGGGSSLNVMQMINAIKSQSVDRSSGAPLDPRQRPGPMDPRQASSSAKVDTVYINSNDGDSLFRFIKVYVPKRTFPNIKLKDSTYKNDPRVQAMIKRQDTEAKEASSKSESKLQDSRSRPADPRTRHESTDSMTKSELSNHLDPRSLVNKEDQESKLPRPELALFVDPRVAAKKENSVKSNLDPRSLDPRIHRSSSDISMDSSQQNKPSDPRVQRTMPNISVGMHQLPPRPVDPRFARQDSQPVAGPKPMDPMPNISVGMHQLPPRPVDPRFARQDSQPGAGPKPMDPMPNISVGMHQLPPRPVDPRFPRQDSQPGAGPKPMDPMPNISVGMHQLPPRPVDPRFPRQNSQPGAGPKPMDPMPNISVGMHQLPPRPVDPRFARQESQPGAGPKPMDPMPNISVGMHQLPPRPVDPRFARQESQLVSAPKPMDPRLSRVAGVSDPRTMRQNVPPPSDPRQFNRQASDPRLSKSALESDMKPIDPRFNRVQSSENLGGTSGFQRQMSQPNTAMEKTSAESGSEQSKSKLDYRNDPRFKRKHISDPNVSPTSAGKRFAGQRKSSMEYSSPLDGDNSNQDEGSGYNSYNRLGASKPSSSIQKQAEVPSSVPLSINVPTPPDISTHDILDSIHVMAPPALDQPPLPDTQLKDIFKTIDPTASPFC